MDHARRKSTSATAFSIVELLVVIGIIAILISLLLPALIKVREQSRRSLCASNISRCTNALYLYAMENELHLPPLVRDGDGWEHVVWVSHLTYNAVVKVTGSPKVWTCPNQIVPWDTARIEERPAELAPYGWLVGYFYLGGAGGMPWWTGAPFNMNPWTSPQRITDSGSLPLMADTTEQITNTWPTDGMHGPRGAVYGAINVTPQSIGVLGGNVGLLDGSVAWKPLSQMKAYPNVRQDPAFVGFW